MLALGLNTPEYPKTTISSLLDVPRSSLYRAQKSRAAPDHSELVEQIEKTILANPGYGSRRVTQELNKHGFGVGRKLVRRLMREHSLLCQIKRKWVRTTDSSHGHRRWPNLVADLQASGLDQVWHSDITYIRLPRGFCYLAVVLDAFSRKVVGWSMSLNIDAALVLEALRAAIKARQPKEGWIHHSDQGVQYACSGYIECVQDAKGLPSMSSKACPYDNAKAESFFASLKKEHVHQEEYLSFQHAKQSIAGYIDDYYNRQRLHSKLGYNSPTEFEDMLKPTTGGRAA
jgi:transposase InsO family protein